MYIARIDMEILRSDEVHELKQAYKDKFNECFMPFNYADFPSTDKTRGSQVYLDVLRKAVKADKPYRIISKYKDIE